jgi:hypothetical protein
LKTFITFFICSIFVIKSGAECPKDVTYLEEGKSSPCSGYLFTREAEAKNYRLLEEGKVYKELSDLKDQKINVVQQRLDLYKDGYADLLKQQRLNDASKALYFFGGILTTYLVFKAIEGNR